jgi:hypothetical protein
VSCTNGETKVVSTLLLCAGHPTKEEEVVVESCECVEDGLGTLGWVCLVASMVPEDEYCCAEEKADASKVTIKVAGGTFASPFYTFTTADDTRLDLADFSFERGIEYTFENVGVSAAHPFYVGASRNEALASMSGQPLGGSGSNSFAFRLPTEYAGELVYYCTVHPSMTSQPLAVVEGRTRHVTFENGVCITSEPICVLGDFNIVSTMVLCAGHPKEEEVVVQSCECVEEAGKLDWVCIAKAMVSEDEHCCDAGNGEMFQDGLCIAPELNCETAPQIGSARGFRGILMACDQSAETP